MGQEAYDFAYRNLFNSIPGGVLQCKNDKYFTIIEINESFVELFGFTRAELQTKFQNQFAQMIHAEDLPHMQRELETQRDPTEQISLVYRVLCKNGRYKWVQDNRRFMTGREGDLFLCVLTDITEIRKAREDLRLSLERHQIIMDQATDIIFEWDILGDKLSFSSNWEKRFGYIPVHDQITERIPLGSHIHPEDALVFVELMRSARAGKSYSSAELRISKSDGKYVWCRIRATDQYDDDGNAIKAVGVITDIDTEKRLIDDLRRRAERDALTGLYNREETEGKIRNFLAEGKGRSGALFMIDTDNFKQVNDTKGHLFGDAVLAELAAGMKLLTRKTDIVGRIGGDEFMIFFKDVVSAEVAQLKGEGLLAVFQKLFVHEKHNLAITCSVGIALYPEAGNNFQALYHNADVALYQAKSQGKNRYCLFNPTCAGGIEQTQYSALGAQIDSDRNGVDTGNDLIGYVFKILYECKEIDHAMELILEIVGKRFDVSRAYVFENSADGLYCDNTYEWRSEGITPQKENLQHYPYAQAENYAALFGTDSIFYCHNVNNLPPKEKDFFAAQDINATLQCAIREDGIFRGFVGFDECTGVRLWTKEEVAALSQISQLLTTFLLKKRLSDRDRKMATQLSNILDMQNSYIYVIDRVSYELLYINKKTRELDATVKIGSCCYTTFFGRIAPCENCPIKMTVPEIYNPKYHIWTSVHVTPMHWDDRKAYLLSCYEVTKYFPTEESALREPPALTEQRFFATE